VNSRKLSDFELEGVSENNDLLPLQVHVSTGNKTLARGRPSGPPAASDAEYAEVADSVAWREIAIGAMVGVAAAVTNSGRWCVVMP
jgi:hypothetical protein